MIHNSILSTIGHTPMVHINRLYRSPKVRITAKIEYFNPGGSIKDRLAMAMITDAESRGQLTPGKSIIEATSGNTGIGLSMACAVKGYKLLLIMPESASEERRRIMKAYGADLMLTPGRLSTDGAIDEAYRLAREYPDKYVLLDQFNNQAGVEAHYQSTALEIWEDTGGALTHAVITLGTSGTAMGVTKRLKELNPNIKIIAVEPNPGHKIQGLKNMHASYAPGIYDRKALDEVIRINDEEAFETARRLAAEEGLFVGMSSGAAMAGAIKIAEKLEQGFIVTIFPDGGERYLSTELFAPKMKPAVTVQDISSGKMVSLSAAQNEHCLLTVGQAMDQPEEMDAWRRIVILESMARFLISKGLKSRVVVSLADLDDRSIKAAKNASMPRETFSEQSLRAMESLARKFDLNPDLVQFIRASQCVEQSIELCRKLLLRGTAYEKLGSIYFDVLRFERYGSLSSMNLNKLSLGKTVDLTSYAKENPKDFTLLKRATLADLKSGDYIKTEWGNMRPSWFLQHAAAALEAMPSISAAMYGDEHLFPHMENFRAIWSLARDLTPSAWLLCRKIQDKRDTATKEDKPLIPAKSDPTLSGSLKMWLLSASYHKPLVLSKESLTMWKQNWHNFSAAFTILRQEQSRPAGRESTWPKAEETALELKQKLEQAMSEDMDLPHFWPTLFQYCQQTKTMLDAGAFSPGLSRLLLEPLQYTNNILGLLDRPDQRCPRQLNQEIQELLQRRDKARGNKDFTLADQLRDRLKAAGFIVRDTAKGQEVTVDDCSWL